MVKAHLNFLSQLSAEFTFFRQGLDFLKCLETRLKAVVLYCRVECVSLRLTNYEMKVILEPGCREGQVRGQV